MNDFWCPPDYNLDWYKKISNIHLKDDILKEVNDKFTPSDDVASLFMPPSFLTAYGFLSNNPLMTVISKNSCVVFKKKS